MGVFIDMGRSSVSCGVSKVTEYGVCVSGATGIVAGVSSNTGTPSSVIPSVGPFSPSLLSVMTKSPWSSSVIVSSSSSSSVQTARIKDFPLSCSLQQNKKIFSIDKGKDLCTHIVWELQKKVAHL